MGRIMPYPMAMPAKLDAREYVAIWNSLPRFSGVATVSVEDRYHYGMRCRVPTPQIEIVPFREEA
jgi:hypothetical protein